MNTQYAPGQPPPNNNPTSYPSMQPPLNGTNNNLYANQSQGMNAGPPPMQNINQKMQSMVLGSAPQPNGQFSNGLSQPMNQFPNLPAMNQFPPKQFGGQIPTSQQSRPPMQPPLNQPFMGNSQPPVGGDFSQSARPAQGPPVSGQVSQPQRPPMMPGLPPSDPNSSSMNPLQSGANPLMPRPPSNFGSTQLPPMSSENSNNQAPMPPNQSTGSMGPPPTSQGFPNPMQQPRTAPPNNFPPAVSQQNQTINANQMPPQQFGSNFPNPNVSLPGGNMNPPSSTQSALGSSAPSGFPNPIMSSKVGASFASGQPMPPLPGQQMSSLPGQQMPPLPGQQSLPGQQMPPMPGQQIPPMPSQQVPPMPGQQMPPMPGQQMPPMPGQQMPHMPGQQMPPMPGQKMPPLPGQQMPPIPGQHMPSQQMAPPTGPNSAMGPPVGSMPHPGMQPYGNQNQPKPQMPGYPGQQQVGGYPPTHAPGYPGQPGQQMGYQQPGYAGQQPGYPGQPGYSDQSPYGAQQQPVKKLNPDQMPSPIQVIMEDQKTNGGMFPTNAKGRVPPLVTTDFTVVDQGNASPRYIRSSMYNVPATPDMMKQSAVPFCVVLSPMAETIGDERPPPLLDFAMLTGVPGSGPVRCSRCKAYMCPAMRFVDAGRHFQCAFCKATTEVPMEYTQYLNNGQHYGQSTPEMSLGCYEIVAPKEYCRNNVLPTQPALIFVVDVSYNAIRSGLVHLVIGRLRSLLESLPIPPRVGLITYSSTIHFYNINKNLGQPQMMVVGDIQDVFVPLAHGLLAEPGQANHLLDALAEQIPLMFQETKETETILLPAVKAGLEALKAAECCGKLLIFHSSLPSAQAPGQLINRDDRKLLGTDKEKNVLNPQTKAYNEVAQDCVANGCGIEMFLFNSSYADLATLSQLSRLTGGSLHKYTYFQADVDGDRFLDDLTRVLSRPNAYDAVMRVRTSTGVRATDFYGHFFMSNTTDVELATLDCDKAIAVEIKHDDKLTGEEGVYIQVALLYTHASGQRRLRICNLALGIATQMADLYRSCDSDTVINFLTKQAIAKLSEHSPKNIKDSIVNRCTHTLACYRKHCANPSSVGQLVLPESLKLLPLYINCLLRSDAVSGGPDMSCDDRSWAMQAALCADVATSVVMLYPRLLCLNPLASGAAAEPIRCTIEKMVDDSIFLLENSVHMMLWVGLQTPPELIRSLFGVNSVAEINTEVTRLPELDNDFNEKIRELIYSIRIERRRCMRLTVVRQHDKLEMVFRQFLVEDDGRNGASSYMDFLCLVHKEIRALL